MMTKAHSSTPVAPVGSFVGHPLQMTQRLALRQRPNGWAVGRQRWSHLLFAHWAVEPGVIQATLPRGLFVDTFGGSAYLGIVPFFMERVRPAWLPPLPGLSWFLELNVRTYVHDAAGNPGVWFYSLDCNQPLAVAIARRFFHLPYFHARMSAFEQGATTCFQSRRRDAASAESRYVWEPATDGTPAGAGTLEFFLVERYLLYATDAHGGLYSGRVHHAPYRIATPKVSEFSVEPARAAGFALSGPHASLLAAGAVDVTVFPLTRVPAMSA
jgi:hypothetical protein